MEKKTKIFLVEIALLLVICSLDSKLLLGFLWVILHEAVHIIVAKKLGVNLYKIQIHITGAKAELEDIDDLSDNKKLLLYSAGPLFNLIMAIILMWIKVSFSVDSCDSSIFMNLGLAIFNMLPAYPLDGIRIYEILLSKKILYKKAKKVLVYVSFIFSVILIVFFSFTVYIHKANFSLLLGAGLIIYTTILEKENNIYFMMGNLFKKRNRLIDGEFIQNKSISIYYKRELVKVLNLIDKNKFNYFFVLDEEFKFLGVIYENELIDALKEYGNITIGELIEIKKINK